MTPDIWARVDQAIDTDPLQLRNIVAELLARATHAENELAALRDHRARWQTEHARAERLTAERNAAHNRIAALDANGAELLTRAEQAEAAIERARTAVHIDDRSEDTTDLQRGYRTCAERALNALDGDK